MTRKLIALVKLTGTGSSSPVKLTGTDSDAGPTSVRVSPDSDAGRRSKAAKGGCGGQV